MPKKKILIISIIIIFIIATIGVYIGKKISQNNEYQIKNDTYFEVTLKPNNYFSNNIIEANNYYIANSIKSIDIYFNYDLKNQKNTNYTYDISATLKSYADNGTKLVWTKDFNLKETTNITQKEINIQENYNLDYPYYVNYVKSFQDYYNIKTENYLDIKLNIKINDKNSSSILLTIPLSDNIIEITMREDNTFLTNKNPTISFDKLIIFAFILIAIVILGKKVLFNKKDENSILKEYQDIIITLQNEPNLNPNNIIYLTNIKDLITIAINNNLNIFNYRDKYYTIIENIYYIYTVNNLSKDLNT